MRNKSSSVTREEVDDLLRFLPQFERPGEIPEAEWHGGKTNQKGVLELAYPKYGEAVSEFFEMAGLPCWEDSAYKPSTVGDLVRSDEAIASASLAEIRSMLTFCVRGERFCDGHWDAMIGTGRIVAILRRLKCLRSEMWSA